MGSLHFVRYKEQRGCGRTLSGQARRWEHLNFASPLEQKLLAGASAHGLEATRMVYRGPERDLSALLDRGEAFLGPVDLQEGEPSRAHENAARLWRRHPRALSLVTGYGLSEDGLFRQHSWLIRNAPKAGQARIIETTVPRTLYYGYILNTREANQLCADELD